jgi:DNA-binding CsgD family transcriptional regulator
MRSLKVKWPRATDDKPVEKSPQEDKCPFFQEGQLSLFDLLRARYVVIMIFVSSTTLLILISSMSLGCLCVVLGYRLQRKYPVPFLSAYSGYLVSSVVYGLLNWTGIALIASILQPGSSDTLKVAIALVTLALPFLILRVVLLIETVLRWTHVRRSPFRLAAYIVFSSAILIPYTFAAAKLFSRPDAGALRIIDGLGTAAIVAQYLSFFFALFARDAKSDPVGRRGLRVFAGTSLVWFSAYTIPAYFVGLYEEKLFRVLLPILYFAVLIPPLLYVARFLAKNAPRLLDIREAHDGLSCLAEGFGLTPREGDIVRLILAGKTNKEIAAELFISPHTVKNATSRIYEKTGVQTRGQLAGKLMPR